MRSLVDSFLLAGLRGLLEFIVVFKLIDLLLGICLTGEGEFPLRLINDKELFRLDEGPASNEFTDYLNNDFPGASVYSVLLSASDVFLLYLKKERGNSSFFRPT